MTYAKTHAKAMSLHGLMTVEPEAALKKEILDQSPTKTLAFESWKTHSAKTRSLDGSLHVKVSMAG